MKNNDTTRTSNKTRCIQLNEIIDAFENTADIKREDAISNTKIIFDIIKEHLIEGNNINLGELGILTHHEQRNNDIPEIRYTPSLPFLSELRERQNKK